MLKRGPAQPDGALLDAAMRAQAHRGPDGKGVIVERIQDRTLLLAHQRLSIIDLSAAAGQPMAYRDRRGWITYNGELYNYLELRRELAEQGERFTTRSDTEVLLAALHKWGPRRALEKFNWMGVFAWFDREGEQVVLGCDPGAEKPLYYFLEDDQLVFASEIKTLLVVAARRFELDRDVVGRFVFQGLTDSSSETFFRHIYRVPPATFTILDLKSDRLRIVAQPYTPPAYPGEPSGMTLPRFQDDLRELLTDAVRIRLRSDVPVGVLLSGGIDSSSIAAIARLVLGGASPPRLLSAVSDDPRFDESTHITAMERHLGQIAERIRLQPNPSALIDDLMLVNWYNDAPVTSLSAVAHFNLMKLAKQLGVTVVLSGQGADEILLGYRKFLGFYIQSLLRQGRIGRALTALGGFALNRTVLNQFSVAEAKRYIGRGRRLASDANSKRGGRTVVGEWLQGWKPAALGLGNGSLADRQVMDVRYYSVPALCHYEDRMSMAMGREIRLPFLDPRLVDMLLRAPDEYKLRSGWTKYALRKAMETLLPHQICWRRDKQGFVNPQSEWLKGELRHQVLDAFGPGSLIARKGILRSDALLEKYERYRKQPAGGGSIWYREIFAPFSLELWMRRYATWVA